MNIVLIGAGNLATNQGKALTQAGHSIMQVYRHTMASADQLASTLDCPATDDLQHLMNHTTKLLFICLGNICRSWAANAIRFVFSLVKR